MTLIRPKTNSRQTYRHIPYWETSSPSGKRRVRPCRWCDAQNPLILLASVWATDPLKNKDFSTFGTGTGTEERHKWYDHESCINIDKLSIEAKHLNHYLRQKDKHTTQERKKDIKERRGRWKNKVMNKRGRMQGNQNIQMNVFLSPPVDLMALGE